MKQVNDKILDKIQALLKLAKNNSNENEAQSAILKAQELMLKYGIEQSQVNSQENTEPTKSDVTASKLTTPGRAIWWQRKLAHIIAKNFRCKFYVEAQGKATAKGITNDMNKVTLCFLGLKNDVMLATEIFRFAVQAIEKGADRCYAKYYNDGKPTKGIKSDYIEGFLAGLEMKFDEQIKNVAKEVNDSKMAIEGESNCTALTLLNVHPIVERFAKEDMGFTTINLNNNSGKQGNVGAKLMGLKDGKNFNGNPNQIK